MYSCTRIEPQGSLPRRGPETSILWQRIYCSSFLSCVSVYRKFFIHSVPHIAKKDTVPWEKWAPIRGLTTAA